MLIDGLNRVKNIKSVLLSGEKRIVPPVFEVNVILTLGKPYKVGLELVPENPENPNTWVIDRINILLHQENMDLSVALEDLESSLKTLEGNQLETISRGIKKASKTIKNNFSDILKKVKEQ